jgi:tetratricopeptide (TPR) repeat protein
MIGSLGAHAQSSATPTQTPDLQRRVDKLEDAQAQTVEALKVNYDHSKFLIQMIGGVIAILVTIQGVTTLFQFRRERQRYEYEIEREKTKDSRQDKRDEDRDIADRSGLNDVSQIMHVVQQTLQSRLSAEEQARKEAKEAHQELQKVLDQITDLKLFYENFQSTIQRARKDLSEAASKWAKEVSRHDFRRMAAALNEFARQFDKFNNEFKDLDKSGETFGARVPYIRGIAAHYANQPDLAKAYLTEVINSRLPEPDENDLQFNRRSANGYYYLGLIEANFGNYGDAIALFSKANELDTKGTDFLTKIVIAEAHSMSNEFDVARELIHQVHDELKKMERAEGRLAHYHQRLRSRAALIHQNMSMWEREDNWIDESIAKLEELRNIDPQYYFATVTLAQLWSYKKDVKRAKELFNESYESIQLSGDLLTVTEARSKILLLMVAGMCCLNVPGNEKKAEEHLDRASDLRSSLPKLSGQSCTVFSILSKRSESSESIGSHIRYIREGRILLEADT